jgi:hypothetical protein
MVMAAVDDPPSPKPPARPLLSHQQSNKPTLRHPPTHLSRFHMPARPALPCVPCLPLPSPADTAVADVRAALRGSADCLLV